MAVLLGDGLETLFGFDLLTTRLISFCVLTPMTFFPISKLAYASVLGVISSTFLVVIVVLDGLTKKTHPGSLWDPMVRDVTVLIHTHDTLLSVRKPSGFLLNPLTSLLALVS
jgi:hypothetical protein